ncbi:glycosyltransferase family 2 protein [Micromonospora sp. NPDC049559]|uniref:glycosyltransferase family 2 protein n=1 Tax=Micromonospora sp. NPDC049559 TaxID=3155923 RepID=UPI0034402028
MTSTAEAATTAGARAAVRDVEVSEPLPELPGRDPDGRRLDRAWLLVRVFTEPVGALMLRVPEAGLAAGEVAAALTAACGEEIETRVRAAGGEPGGGLPPDGVRVPNTPPYLARRAEVLRAAPPVTVVICTRDRPAELSRCLESVLAQGYPNLRVLVVDNAPTGDGTARVAREAARRAPVEYLVAPVPGLSRARNVAVAAARGETLAWLDDDEVADPYWLSEIARALVERPEADVISGVIVPAELATAPQLWFEQFGGHSKGRGFTPAVFSPATAHRQSPLYPLPPFATGANMVFRPGVIESIGGFDPALGAGTPAMGGEDTRAFTQVLLAGGTIAYRPTVLARHTHRRDLDGLRRQLRGYGVGLTAFYTSLLLDRPGLLLPLLRLAPGALRDLTRPDSPRVATIEEDFPAELLRDNRRAMAYGPLAYLRGRRHDRRLRRAGTGRVSARSRRDGEVS